MSGGLQSAWNLQWNAPFASPSQLQSSTTPMQQYPGDQSSLLAGQVSSFPISALPGAGPSSEKKGIGRPRDFVWTLFDGDSERASCRVCNWSSDRPKAFRMRQHILNCSEVDEEDRQRVRNAEEAREAAAIAKQEDRANDVSVDLSNPSPLATPGSISEAVPNQPTSTKKRKASTSNNASNERSAKTINTLPSLQTPMPQATRSPITCHVLDATSGKPAAGITCRLDSFTSTGFVVLATAMTDSDGRCTNILASTFKIEPGVYKMTFLTKPFFDSKKIDTFYPFVEIPFEIKSTSEHYHIPLLLSPFAYSTYRGS